MVFVAVKKGMWRSQRREKAVNRVTYSTPSAQSTCLLFSLSGDLVKELGAPKRVKVLLGSGEHKGCILIKAAAVGETDSYSLVGQKTAHVRKFSVSRYRLGLPGKAHYKTAVTNHRMTEEGLMVWLPA